MACPDVTVLRDRRNTIGEARGHGARLPSVVTVPAEEVQQD
jgi:hypothetical protein